MIKKKYLIIAGPTAIGKSELALNIAKIFDGEIINADSRQIYKDFNIGTGKPLLKERQEIKHHMFDIIDGKKRFSAYEYMEKASELIKEISKRNKLPIVVGGTGLYIRALLRGLFHEGEADLNLRKKFYKKGEKLGWDKLYAELKGVDKQYSKKISKNDKKRIVRALEVYYKTGNPISYHFKRTDSPLKDFQPIKIYLNDKRKNVYRKINERVIKMFEKGFVEEVKFLLKEGYNKDSQGFQSIGYKHILDYIRGRKSKEKTIELIQKDSRKYSKRQATWFKKEKGFQQFKPEERKEIIKYIKNKLKE